MPFLTKNARRISRIIAGIILLSAVIWGGYHIWLRQTHAVIVDQVYRSAQLSPQILQQRIRAQHIKSVFNLRGEQVNSAWYVQEVAATQQMGAEHFDLTLDAHKIPSKEALRKLVYVLMHAPRPILVHCLGGADRSGLASAVAMILNDAPLTQSQYQISILHLVLSPHSIGKLVFPYYQHWLTQNKLTHSRENFLHWVCSTEPFDGHESAATIEDFAHYNPCADGAK